MVIGMSMNHDFQDNVDDQENMLMPFPLQSLPSQCHHDEHDIDDLDDHHNLDGCGCQNDDQHFGQCR